MTLLFRFKQSKEERDEQRTGGGGVKRQKSQSLTSSISCMSLCLTLRPGDINNPKHLQHTSSPALISLCFSVCSVLLLHCLAKRHTELAVERIGVSISDYYQIITENICDPPLQNESQ